MPFGWAGWQMLPPYFPEDVDIQVRDLIPAYDKFPVETRSIFCLLIASVVYHTQCVCTVEHDSGADFEVVINVRNESA